MKSILLSQTEAIGSPLFPDTTIRLANGRTFFSGKLKAGAIASSIDGKGHWRDNIFIERL